jgi:L-ribulose-5-phosphate 3-epimerase
MSDSDAVGQPAMSRRQFIGASAGAALVASGVAGAAITDTKGKPVSTSDQRIRKALIYGDTPGALSMEDRFKLVRDVGFDAVEAPPITDLAECEKMRAAAEKAGTRIHSVIFGGWQVPLTVGDPEEAKISVAAVEAGLRGAHAMGADAMLLVPGVVNAHSPYGEAYKNSHANIMKLIPVAAELKIIIAIENVWNNFLLSPLEMARYIDDFKSPWVQAYFDVGNVVRYAWSQDWIRTLGKRIKKVHLKDFKGGPGLGTGGEWVPIGEGSIDWPEVRKAFAEIGYHGYATTEVGGGDEAYLRNLAATVDRVLTGG